MTRERITHEQLVAREENLNRRLERSGSRVYVQGRNGQFALDELRASDGAVMRTITVGTKREIADFLHAAMVGIDLSRVSA